MFSHPSQVHPSRVRDYEAMYTAYDGELFNQAYPFHEVSAAEYSHFYHAEIAQPHSASLHHIPVRHLDQQRYSTPSSFHKPVAYIPHQHGLTSPVQPFTNSPTSRSQWLHSPQRHARHFGVALPLEDKCSGTTSPHSVSPILTASSTTSQRPSSSHSNLSWSDAEQYFHVGEGELWAGSASPSGPSVANSGPSSGDSGSGYSIRSRAAVTHQRLNANYECQPRSASSSDYSRTTSFRNVKTNPPPQKLGDLVERKLIGQWARREQDSRSLQKLMCAANEKEHEMAWHQIAKERVELSCHVFGNYVIQKFLEHGSQELRDEIVLSFKEELKLLSQDNFGCRVVQKAIEVSNLSMKKMMLDCLSSHLAVLVACRHGNHVVQKFVMELPGEDLIPIYRVFDGRVVGHCFQMYGCRVVQRLHRHATAEFRNKMTRDILEHCLRLAKDQWGNYVLQYLIENEPKSTVKAVAHTLLTDFKSLSFDKLASNVMEKCVEHTTSSVIDLFVKCLLTRSNEELVKFLTHEYGNYVVQTIIERSSYKQGAHKIHRRLQKYGLAQQVKSTTAGRRVMGKLDEKFDEYQRSRKRSQSLEEK